MTESGVIHLGKTDLRISALGIGAWQWGDNFFWGYGLSYTDADLQAAFAETLKAGINFIDTAELYGPWTSERKLGEFIRNSAPREKIVIATKFYPFPWRLRRSDLVRALRRSLKRLGLPQVDLYQTHWPHPPIPVETWMEGMADAVGDGLTCSVGVSNYSADQMKRSHDTLARRGIPLASNQFQYSLLHRLPERNGVLATCRELGVTPIAYSPIAKGILSGKYTPGNPPPGLRAMRYNREYLARVQPLSGLVREIGQARGKTPSQVALNWLICKGAVPIPGAKNVRQAQENAGALGWRLAESEVVALDAASDSVNSKQ